MKIILKTEQNKRDWILIRTEVFIKEQGFKNEFDEIDNSAVHLTVYADGEPAGCGRVFEENGYFVIGRIAVRKQFRNLGLGKVVMDGLEKIAMEKGAKKIRLTAQIRAKGFYKRLGYREFGEPCMDEHVEHIKMEKEI